MMRALFFLILMLAAVPLEAATTATWEMNTYQDFLKGRFHGVSLSREGRLMLAPAMETLFSAGQPAVWSVARAANGRLYLGTGHGGRVYEVDSSGKGRLLWTAAEPEVFAVALDKKDVLYAATSPRGKVYRIEKGRAEEFFAPGETYIWSLAFAGDGALFVGTGDEGKIYRVDGSGKGELYYDTGQRHVTCLAFDAAGRLLAGTEPNGILYQISAKDKAFVLYDANLPEIRSVAVAADGVVYAAALGGSVARRAAAALAAPARTPKVTAPATSITVRAAQGGVEIKPKPQAAKPAAAAAAPVTPAPAIEISGVEKSALYRIGPGHAVETLWSSTEENAYDLVTAGRSVIFSTDKQGRLYQLGPDRKVTLLTETNESEAIRLLPLARSLLVATSDMGKIFRLGSGPGSSGTYEAPVHDAARPARWGRLRWHAEPAPGSRLIFQTRSGNTARPDKTWSEWSAPLTDPEGSLISSPSARFIQWRARFTGPGGRSPVLDSVTLAYLPQNARPKVTSITVSTQTAPNKQSSTPASSTGASAPYSITVTDTGETGASTLSGTSTQKMENSTADRLQIAWQAEDLDGDRLVYSLFFRGEGEREWKLMKADLKANKFTVESDVLADGKYFFRVEVSDRLANPPAAALSSDRVSAPVLVDHTPPVVTIRPPKRVAGAVEAVVEAADATSALRRCEYSVDAGPWTPMAPEDGIIDTKRERFLLRSTAVSSGEHLLVVRVYDSAGNAGLAKIVLR